MKNGTLLLTAVVAFLLLFGSDWAKGEDDSIAHTQEREWFSRGQEAIAFAKYDEAIICFENALSINPGFTDVHRFIGDAYMKKGMPDSAIQAYKKALDSKVQMVPALAGLGSGYFQKAMYAEALAAYERALAIQPDNASSHIGRGDVYYKKDDPERALADYRKGLSLEPDHADAQFNVGLILQARAEPGKAAQHFYKAGLLFIKRGDRDDAFKAYDHLKQTEDEKLLKLLNAALQPSIK